MGMPWYLLSICLERYSELSNFYPVRARRLGRVVAACAATALAFTLAGCSGTDTGDGADGSSTEAAQGTPALDTATVTGGFGETPEVTAGDSAKLTDQVERKVLVEGDGAPLTEDMYPVLKVATFDFGSGEPLSDYASLPVQSTLAELQLPEPVHSGLLSPPSGSRIVLLPPATEAAQKPGSQQTPMYVIDVIGVEKNQAADGKPAENSIDFIEVSDGDDGSPQVKIAADAPKPAEQLISTVLQGDGPEVGAGDEVVVQYRGVLLDGTEFDSSWARGGVPTMFSTDGVVTGFADALVGQQVGSRVVTVFPPELGYGDQETGSIPADSHLVFVVDILAVYPKTTNQ